MKHENRSMLYVSYAFLLVPLVFAFTNIGYYILGIENVFENIRSFFNWIETIGLNWLMDILIIFGPVIAIYLSLRAVIKIKLQPEENSWVHITVVRANQGYFLIIGISVMLMLIFGTYILVENGPCFFGGLSSC